MDTKARIGLFVGGLVLVGMVAWILMPGPKQPDADQVALVPDTAVDQPATPATLPATQPVDIFAGPTTQPVAPSTLSLDGPVPTIPEPAPAVAVGPADSWARALDGNNAATTVTPGASPMLGTESTGTFPRHYKVGSGESFYTISEKVYGNGKYAARIAAANPSVDPKRLKVGQEITLPDVSAAISATSVAPSNAPVAGTGAKTYKVQAGDSLRKISTKVYGTDANWEKIYSANRAAIGSDPSKLRAGMTLQIP